MNRDLINKITSIEYENKDCHSHCDTCDYGTEYIRELTIKYEDGTKLFVHINTEESSGYNLSESDMMLILANSTNIESIIEGIKEKLAIPLKYPEYDDIYYEINGQKFRFGGN